MLDGTLEGAKLAAASQGSPVSSSVFYRTLRMQSHPQPSAQPKLLMIIIAGWVSVSDNNIFLNQEESRGERGKESARERERERERPSLGL